MLQQRQIIKHSAFYGISQEKEIKAWDVHPHYAWIILFYSDGSFELVSYSNASFDSLLKGI